MPLDVTMCPGKGCPLKEICFRHRAVPVGRQDWLSAPPYRVETGKCSWFWDIQKEMPTTESIRRRAYDIWMRAGCPEGQADAHWLQAEQEMAPKLR